MWNTALSLTVYSSRPGDTSFLHCLNINSPSPSLLHFFHFLPSVHWPLLRCWVNYMVNVKTVLSLFSLLRCTHYWQFISPHLTCSHFKVLRHAPKKMSRLTQQRLTIVLSLHMKRVLIATRTDSLLMDRLIIFTDSQWDHPSTSKEYQLKVNVDCCFCLSGCTFNVILLQLARWRK